MAQESAPTLEGHLSLGQYFLNNNAVGRAVSEFEAAVRLAPDRAEAQYNLGNALRLWGDAVGAEKALRTALSIQPQFPEAHFVLGLLFGDQVGSEHLGLPEFQAAIKQKPDYAEAHFNIGIINWKTGEPERALQEFRLAVRANPQSAGYRVPAWANSCSAQSRRRGDRRAAICGGVKPGFFRSALPARTNSPQARKEQRGCPQAHRHRSATQRTRGHGHGERSELPLVPTRTFRTRAGPHPGRDQAANCRSQQCA